MEELDQRVPFATAGEELVVSLLRSADAARRFMAGVLLDEDLTDQQYNVLRILRGAGSDGIPTLEIGRRMVERTPGVTRLVDRLMAKDLVARERDPADRRRIVCSITEEGTATLERIRPRLEAAVAALETTLPPEILGRLATDLSEVRGALRTSSPPRTQPPGG